MNQKASVSVRVLCAATGFLSLYGIVFLERGVSQQDPAERVERRQQSGASAGSAHAPGLAMTRCGEGRGSFVLECSRIRGKCAKRENQLIAKAGLKNLLVGPLGFEPRTNGL